VKPAYKQVELIVEHGPGIRSEAEADALVARVVSYAKRLGLAKPYIEDYDEDPSASWSAP